MAENQNGDGTQFEQEMEITTSGTDVPLTSPPLNTHAAEPVTSHVTNVTHTVSSPVPTTNPSYWTTDIQFPAHLSNQPLWQAQHNSTLIQQPAQTSQLRYSLFSTSAPSAPLRQSTTYSIPSLYMPVSTQSNVEPRSANPFYTEPPYIAPPIQHPMQYSYSYLPQPSAPTVTYAQLPYPRLTANDIEAWFMSWGYWFEASGIFDDLRKFNTILAALDPTVLPQLSGILSSVPPTNRYDYIKERITKHYRESNQKIINRLLSDMTLGDLKPSQLYFEMKRVAGNVGITDDALKELWARRLPDYARIAVAGTGRPTLEFTQQADAIVEALRSSTIAAVSTSVTTSTHSDTSSQNAPTGATNEMSALIAGIQELTREFRSMKNDRSRQQSRDRTPSRNKRDRSTSSKSKLCYYHRRFGDKATKCACPHAVSSGTTEQEK